MNDFGAFKLCSMVLSITVLTSFACGFPPEASASDAFISGQVQVSDGSPAAAAKVILIQLPSDGSERTAKVGSPLKIIELAHTISGASGEFSFGPEVERLARVSTGGANSLNFQIVTISGDEMGSYFFSVEPGATLTGRVAVASNISTPAQNMQLRTLKGPGDSSRASSATAGDNHAIPMDNPTTCSSRVLNKYNPRWSTVGATWSKTGSVDSTFVYSRGSNSSLGVGVSAVGSSGSFSASGTNSVTTTDATTFPIQSANSKTWMRSEFLTGRYVTSCTQQLPYKTWNTYYFKAYAWAGGAQAVATSYLPTPRYCAYYQQRAKFTSDQTRASAASAGLSVADIIGINLSAQTGWSTATELSVAWNHGSGYMCGSTGYPGDHAQNHGSLIAVGVQGP